MEKQKNTLTLYNDDCLNVLEDMEENSVDSVVTDPPYLIGFMGKDFDKSGITFQVELWEKIKKVLKPGGHLLVFGGTRTYHRMACAVEDAGFEIRDTIHWVYGSGFPKSLSISKQLDKMTGKERKVIGKVRRWGNAAGKGRAGQYANQYESSIKGAEKFDNITAPATEAAKKWDGWGTALKPAHELILVARKPLSEPNVASNVLKWGCGGINVDGCRISLYGEKPPSGSGKNDAFRRLEGREDRWKGSNNLQTPPQGRWPANFLLSHSEGCVRRGGKRIKPSNPRGSVSFSNGKTTAHEGWRRKAHQKYEKCETPSRINPDGLETVEDWDCVEGCPVKLLDGQSGMLKSGRLEPWHKDGGKTVSVYGEYKGRAIPEQGFGGDTGGASRFFKTFEYEPFHYCAKASRRERNEGLENPGLQFKHGTTLRKIENTSTKGNNHPCVKPVKLLRYLCRLVTPPKGTVLDPFMGSGSTGIAACEERLNFVGMEMERDYFEIAEARIKHARKKKLKTKLTEF